MVNPGNAFVFEHDCLRVRNGLLMKHRFSDNVVPVKHFLSVLTRALRGARHFALVEAVPYQPKARS
jgi:hypothetical protein